MGVLSEIEPKRALFYFEEISGIPRGSSNIRKISDYCVSFAKNHNLEYIQDEEGNVIIFKKAHPNYVDAPTVIMQGHLDMVCEKELGYDIDFENEAIKLSLDGTILSAEGTTLGGDDGVAVCFMLAILEDDTIKAPSLECVFTVDEEIGMLGAQAMDMSCLKGRLMLNLDHGEEGSILVGCAGGVTATCHLPVNRVETQKKIYSINIDSLTGGHSGEAIIKQRANANVLLGRLLNELKKKTDLLIVSVEGGAKDNAIARSASALVCLDEEKEKEFAIVFDEQREIFNKEFSITDPEMNIDWKREDSANSALDEESTKKVICSLLNLPAGIQKMSLHIPGLVQSSLNMGILASDEKEVTFSFSVRSDLPSEKKNMCDRMESLMECLGGYVSFSGDYPSWEYKANSYLQGVVKKAFEDKFGYEAVVGTIHAGLECGIFSNRLQGLDCVSIGPNMKDIHTPSETLDLESTKRYWDYVLTVLERIK